MIDFDFSLLINDALKKFQGRNDIHHIVDVENIISPLIDALQKYPLTRGSADALHLIGIIHMATLDSHRSEMSCLLVHRFRKTLMNKLSHFNSLVNLTRACINLKSFDEAYQYGLIGERIDNEDLDLLSNMTVASFLSNRKDESRERFEKIKKLDPIRTTEVHDLCNWKSNLKRTDHFSCNDLVEKFEHMKDLKDFEQFKINLSELQKRPDGRNAWKCWRILCEMYIDMMPKNSKSEYLRLQSIAGLAAASGKAIAFHHNKAINDLQLWQWRRDALRKLEFNLSDANFCNANLQNANLTNDNLNNTNFENANLTEAKGNKLTNCYIATAVYKDPNCSEVNCFKKIRDFYLSKYKLGKFLIKKYYKYSPAIASKMNSEKTNTLIRKALFNPLYKIVKSTINSNQ